VNRVERTEKNLRIEIEVEEEGGSAVGKKSKGHSIEGFTIAELIAQHDIVFSASIYAA